MTKTIDKSKLDNYNKFTSESGHWYDQEGEPAYTLIGANGKERNTTLRDAKNLGLVPSVTTIIGMAAKPGLENWKITQAIKAATMADTGESIEDMDSFINKCKYEARQVGLKAAKEGTKIHAQIERGFQGKRKHKPYKIIKQWLDDQYSWADKWTAEGSFCAPQGYGGKIDLYCDNVFVDFKTKDNLKNKDPSRLVYDEHGMQLSAYAQGMGIDSPERVSIFVDRKDTSIVLFHVWDTESHEKHKEMFNNLLRYWQLSKNYEWNNGK